ncbi:MAG: glycosyltransferase family 2 protein [Betaproteobacteria bacterium]|nr:glycosyltransferase family 2 protein [Betaproteobacteria bacterium]
MIIATLNRPALLLEAVQSALEQTRSPLEVIVIDDGSDPPVDAQALARQFGDRVRLIRNSPSQGLAWARHQGVEAAAGDCIVHLDDDDLYGPDALSRCARLLDDDADLDMVFMGVQGFGKSAAHFNQVHPAGAMRVVEQSQARTLTDGVFVFDRDLVHGLLNQVPMPFQRVMARREAWHKVSQLRVNAYRRAFGLNSDEQARALIRGTLRDSEWAIYAGLACKKAALIAEPLYLQRCDGQGASSRPAMRRTHIRQTTSIKSVLDQFAQLDSSMQPLRHRIRQSLAQTHFDAAYELIDLGFHAEALTHLRDGARLSLRWGHLKLLAKLGLAVATSSASRHPA